VSAYEEVLTIPTYKVGAPDPNPRFYSGRAYQGAQGRVFPYAMLDRLTDERVETPYNVLYLENEYVKVGVLPEIGGRVFEAKDKTNEYDFLYRQHVIKPALIGMLGAWISGGIEWNFPHHHRSRSFMPMDYTLADSPDGAKTILLSELELRHRLRFTVGITVYPGKSYFEATIKLYNGTPFVRSFLYWANPAVHAGPEYQIIFPPGTEYAAYHGKNEFADWPIARASYRSIDYEGVDLSRWENHPSPISFFAWNYRDDFLAGYDHERDAGVVYVADHHIAPGKKFWEWGPGPRGRLWDQILTDEDGPYVELMAGAFSDNQPDYSWLQPYESKRVRQYWYPIRGIGGVKNATLEAAVNLEVDEDGAATIGFHTTARHEDARVRLAIADSLLFEATIDIDPADPFVTVVALPAATDRSALRASLVTAAGQELVSYQRQKPAGSPSPEVVEPPPSPADIATVEELYLAGQRLEQFHNPAIDASAYYEEALRRDPGHSRSNIALGVGHLERGLFQEAEERSLAALERVTKNHTSPRDGEAYYYLGLAKQYQGEHDEAYDALYRAAWSSAFHSAAYYRLAQIDCLRGDFEKALAHLSRSIETDARNRNALNMRAAVLRHLGRHEDAATRALAALEGYPTDVWALHELVQAHRAAGNGREAERAEERLVARRLAKLALSEHAKPWHEAQSWLDAQPFLEIAAEYGAAGLWSDAIDVLSVLTDGRHNTAVTTYPMVYYFLGYFVARMGAGEAAGALFEQASKLPAEYCFPFRLEAIDALRSAQRHNPDDALARYCLGNLLYERQPQAAVREWESARSLGTTIPTVYRNLARAYVQLEQEVPQAIAAMEKALELDAEDPRLLYELDLLYEAGDVSAAERLAVLERHHQTIVGYSDAFAREVVLLTQLGRYDEAIEFMRTNHFRRWEGLGNIHTTFVDAHLLRAGERARAGRLREAISDYEAALEYPANLEVAEPYHGGRACEVYYLMGAAYDAAGDSDLAWEFYQKASTATRSRGRSALDYYQGMALRKLDRHEEAQRLFDALVIHARDRLRSLKGGSSLEFFTKFGSRRSPGEQQANAYYLLGLGYLGKGDRASARAAFSRALQHKPNHVWARAQALEVN
jgi:tetratricopeptide (TPR) repeat protein